MLRQVAQGDIHQNPIADFGGPATAGHSDQLI